MTSLVLVHSPLVGPATWGPVADVLRAGGATVLVPELDAVEGTGAPYWLQHAQAGAAALRGLPVGERPFEDSTGNLEIGGQRLEPVSVIRAGRLYPCTPSVYATQRGHVR